VKLTPKPNVTNEEPLSDIPGTRKVGEEISGEATSIHPLRGENQPGEVGLTGGGGWLPLREISVKNVHIQQWEMVAEGKYPSHHGSYWGLNRFEDTDFGGKISYKIHECIILCGIEYMVNPWRSNQNNANQQSTAILDNPFQNAVINQRARLVAGGVYLNWLVVSTHLKNISQNGNLPQIGVNIKNI